MARPKSYDRNVAIERACRAFWQHGYEALGVRALETLTGLNKFAIRNDFAGKEGLYLEALDFYHSAARDTVLAPMQDGGIEALAQFFDNLVTEGSVNSSGWGCLMVNTGIENAEIRSSSLKNASEFYWSDLRDHFILALQKSQKAGELKQGLNIDDASQGLVTAVMGIHAMNRISGAHDAGRQLVQLVHDLLASWRDTDASPLV